MINAEFFSGNGNVISLQNILKFEVKVKLFRSIWWKDAEHFRYNNICDIEQLCILNILLRGYAFLDKVSSTTIIKCI